MGFAMALGIEQIFDDILPEKVTVAQLPRYHRMVESWSFKPRLLETRLGASMRC